MDSLDEAREKRRLYYQDYRRRRTLKDPTWRRREWNRTYRKNKDSPTFKAQNYARVKAWRKLGKRNRQKDAEYQRRYRASLSVQTRQAIQWRCRLKREFGMTPEQYEDMVAAQQGQCAICGGTDARLEVDHNHTTNVVRELLCGHCNKAIGLLRENPDTAIAAAAYLQKHAPQPLVAVS